MSVAYGRRNISAPDPNGQTVPLARPLRIEGVRGVRATKSTPRGHSVRLLYIISSNYSNYYIILLRILSDYYIVSCIYDERKCSDSVTWEIPENSGKFRIFPDFPVFFSLATESIVSIWSVPVVIRDN